MKKVFNILAGVAVMASVVACDVEYDPIVIVPNPELNKTGMQTVNTISIYDEQETVINIARTAGLSKEMNINVVVDEALLDEYNLQNSTSFEVLPSEYYILPEEVILAKETLDVDFTVVTKPAAMVAGLGRTEASNYVLPLRIESPVTGIDSKQDVVSVLLRPSIDEPKVTVDIPKTMPALDFISIVQLPQTVDLTAAANFNTLDVKKIEFKALGQAEVDAYNAANGTSYVLLDSEYYKMTESFDAEAMVYKTAIEFSCWMLSDANVYLLPIEAETSAYGLEQKEIIYISVQMSQLKVWLSTTEMNANKKQVEVGVEINTAMPDDLEFDLVFDASLVDTYNTANSTSHAALDTELVTIGKAVVAAGSKVGKAVIDLDLNSVPYDEGKFLAPLSIDANSLAEGTLILDDQKSIYLVVYNTIVGVYEADGVWRSAWNTGGCFAKPMSNYGDNIYDIKLATDTADGAGRLGQKYASKYSFDMHAYFDVDFSKEIDPTFVEGATAFAEKPGSGCYAIINVEDRGALQSWPDSVSDNFSYFDSNTGNVYFDFIIMGYWSPGGAGGKEMPAGCTKPGDWFCAEFKNRTDKQ